MIIKIEKGIPIPPPRGLGISAALRAMDVGDSFLITGRNQASASSALGRFAPKKFATRNVEGGVRIWRTE
jgi:hypothetical protein